MDCFNKQVVEKIAERYLGYTEEVDTIITSVKSVHVFTLDYELHSVVTFDLYLDNTPEKYMTVTFEHIGTLICDNNDEYTFITIDYITRDNLVTDNHLVYDYDKNALLTYAQFANLKGLSVSSRNEFPW